MPKNISGDNINGAQTQQGILKGTADLLNTILRGKGIHQRTG